MSRIAARFEALKGAGRKALIPFITAGDPSLAATVPLMHRLVEEGADLIELGVPFSDPMADGPVIQRASERALKHHTSLVHVLEMVAAFRKDDAQTPVILMGYLNPIEVMGFEAFAKAAGEAGVDGVLTVDIPPEEDDGYLTAMRANGLAPIFLLSPTTRDARIAKVCAVASGFVYYVSLKGVTGAGNAAMDTTALGERLDAIRRHTPLPVGVGFGIKDGPSAASAAKVADAVIVGSALVKVIEAEGADDDLLDAVGNLIRELRGAMDAA